MSRRINPENLEYLIKLGEGSFGVVDLMQEYENDKFKRLVAVKRIRDYAQMTIKEQAFALKKVKEELEIGSAVIHPNLVQHYAYFANEKRLFLTMEYVEGIDLYYLIEDHWRKKMFIVERTIWTYILQIARGLKALHDKNILHRDLKPENIFMSQDGKTLKIGDFGLACFVENTALRPHIGTNFYNAPEKWTWFYDFSSDVWSLGCILYELAVHYSPFFIDYVSDEQLKKDVHDLKYPSIKSRTPKGMYSEQLTLWVELCLDIDPKNRATVEDVINASERNLNQDEASSGLLSGSLSTKFMGSAVNSDD